MSSPSSAIQGQPCLAKFEYRDQKTKVTVPVNAEGVVLAQGGANTAWTKIDLLREDDPKKAIIWVPTSYLEIGRGPKVGESPLIDFPMRPTVSLQSFPPSAGSLVRRFALTCINGILNADPKPDISPHARSILSDSDQLGNLLTIIDEGCDRAKSSEILNKPSFTALDLVNGLQPAKNSARCGIYVLLYRLPDKTIKVYVGRTTVTFKSRLSNHESRGKNNPTGSHYAQRAKAMQPGGNMAERILCDIESSDATITATAEQLFIMLLQSYSSEVLNYKPRPMKRNRGTEPDEDRVHPVEELAKHFVASRDAQLFSQIASQTQSLLGCTGGVKSESFGADDGCNWSSPLTESDLTRTIWVRTDFPGRCSQYRRPPVSVFPQTKVIHGAQGDSVVESKVIRAITTAGQRHWDFVVNKKSDPPECAEVHTIIEITPPGRIHPRPWARLPPYGVWQDWKDANRLGIRLEWIDPESKKWCARNVQVRNHHKVENVGFPGCIRQYAMATALIRFFEGKTLAAGHVREGFDFQYGPARVKYVRWLHLEQRIAIEDFVPSIQDANTDGPRARRLEDVGQMLLDSGAGTYGTFPSSGIGHRTMCDHCFLRNARVCERNKTDLACKTCYGYGMPCTWTHNVVLRADTELKQAISVPEKHNQSITDIDPREIHHFTTET